MDLSEFETSKFADVGSVMPVRHPKTGDTLKNEDGSDMTVTVYGTDGDVFQKAQRAKINSKMKLRRTSGKMTAEEIQADTLDLLAAATADWNITLDGAKPEFTPANVRAVYTRLPWLRKQVDEWMADEANFSPAS